MVCDNATLHIEVSGTREPARRCARVRLRAARARHVDASGSTDVIAALTALERQILADEIDSLPEHLCQANVDLDVRVEASVDWRGSGADIELVDYRLLLVGPSGYEVDVTKCIHPQASYDIALAAALEEAQN